MCECSLLPHTSSSEGSWDCSQHPVAWTLELRKQPGPLLQATCFFLEPNFPWWQQAAAPWPVVLGTMSLVIVGQGIPKPSLSLGNQSEGSIPSEGPAGLSAALGGRGTGHCGSPQFSGKENQRLWGRDFLSMCSPHGPSPLLLIPQTSVTVRRMQGVSRQAGRAA